MKKGTGVAGQKHLTVMWTDKYDIFVLHRLNRKIKPTKVRQKIKKLRAEGWIGGCPMLCRRLRGGKLEILDGQHRFEAAKEIGIKVSYVVDNACESDPSQLNEAMPWGLQDHVESYVAAGNADYLIIEDFRTKYDLPLGVAASLLAGECGHSNNTNGKIREGLFKVRDRRFAERAGMLIMRVSHVLREARTANAAGALSRFLLVDEFVAEELIDKCEKYPGMLHACGKMDQYSEMFAAVYNRQRKAGRLPLTFLADEAARRRNVRYRDCK